MPNANGLDLGGVFALGLDLTVPSLDLENATRALGERATLAHRSFLLPVRALGALLALALDHPTVFVTANDERLLLQHFFLQLAPYTERWSRGYNRQKEGHSKEKATLTGVTQEQLLRGNRQLMRNSC